jgi:hypothetical protein
MKKLVMPEREPSDGAVRIGRTLPSGSRMVFIEATHGGETECLRISEYNAWRILGMLSLVLEIPLTKEAQRAIKL